LNKKGSGIGLGLALGVAIGITTDNLGLWLALGILFGSAWERKRSKKEEDGVEPPH
tara:strand:- start:64156 stop:64323 length:168 start_codon:yes stop_codon:yes gene_type:complete